MLKCEVNNTKEFKNLLIGVSKIVEELKLDFSNDGISFTALDTSHINLIQVGMKIDFFIGYSLHEPFSIVISTVELGKILKRLNSGDKLELEADENELNLIMTYEGTRTFTIKTVSNEYESPVPPEVNYDVTDIDIPLNLLTDSVRDCTIVDTKIKLCLSPDYFLFNCEGTFNSVKGSFIHGQLVQNTVVSTFNLENIQKLIGLNVGNVVSLSMGNDSPILAKITNSSEDLSVSMMIAPRIEAE